eukprot:TRINITY_DN6215_c0_g1_i1.p1 TRINITY_DN6215_c0_g1~~TRINITY_DN6215_c0_g1_i1.p1  ORF type:complete len:155 (-),score=11.81 TRINITY_DN6215_c0_g1_i1:52-516(-)
MDPETSSPVTVDDSNYASSGSRDKVKDRLGLDFDDPEEVLKLKDTTLDSRQQRINNRKDNKKACEILGHDPSKEKLAAVLGADVDQIDSAIDESLRSKYGARKTFVIKSKNISKALQVLGFDPAVVKAFEILGVEFDTLRDELAEASDHIIAVM